MFNITFGFNFVKCLLAVIISVISRLLRFAVDTAEFAMMKSESEKVLKKLRESAERAEDPKVKEKFSSEADRLEKIIEKYSKKSKKD